MLLDLLCNFEIIDVGIGYFFFFRKLNCLDIFGIGFKDIKIVKYKFQIYIGFVYFKVFLKEFDYSNCKIEGWVDQIVLQWECVIVEVVKLWEILEFRMVVQCFYGKWF